MIEADYDSHMMELSSLPAAVKERRIHQHLSNEAVAEFLANDYDGQAEFVVLAHLSGQNRPELAQAAAESALKKRSNR
jgi:phosphoribosyl 1,2-cyclic phosphodiesterase